MKTTKITLEILDKKSKFIITELDVKNCSVSSYKDYFCNFNKNFCNFQLKKFNKTYFEWQSKYLNGGDGKKNAI